MAVVFGAEVGDAFDQGGVGGGEVVAVEADIVFEARAAMAAEFE